MSRRRRSRRSRTPWIVAMPLWAATVHSLDGCKGKPCAATVHPLDCCKRNRRRKTRMSRRMRRRWSRRRRRRSRGRRIAQNCLFLISGLILGLSGPILGPMSRASTKIYESC